MKIAIACDVPMHENNGTTIATLNLARHLKNSGHEVRIICPDESKSGSDGFYIVPKFNLFMLNNYVAKNGVCLAKPDENIIRKALDGVDVVHIIMPFALGNRTAKIAIEMGIPVTAGFHCQAENFTSHVFLKDNKLANLIAYKTFYKKLYSKCKLIHYPSQFIRDTFESVVGKTNGRVISNGVKSEFLKKQVEKPQKYKDKYIILFTGRYSKEKSHTVLIDAVSRSKYASNIQLIFAGDGPRKNYLIEYAKKAKIIPPVMEFFTREKLVDIINFADLYVHPAEIEIEAISCLEAIACGKVPIISNSPRSATRHFALSDKNLFDVNNASDLAKKIDYWLDHPEEKSECSNSYLGYSKQFDFETCMQKTEQLIIDAAEGKNEA